MSSRHEKFMETLKYYINNTKIINTYDNEFECVISSLTTNKRLNSQMYKLTIPKKVKYYEIDRRGRTPEIVYRNQDLPTVRELENDFDNYFSPYRLLENLVMKSYITIVNLNLSDEGLVGFINVFYYKNHIPFPNNQISINMDYFNARLIAKDDEIDGLMDKLDESYSNKILQKKKFAKREREYNEKIRNMEKKIRQLYSEKAEKEECPVCYECLDTNEMIIPDCLHNICTSCCYKCDECPLCRAQYSDSIKPIVIHDINDINNLLYSRF